MTIFTIISFVRAYPIETVKFFFYSFKEMLTSNNSVRSTLLQLLTRITVNINVSSLGLNCIQSMTVLASLSLFTHSRLEHGANNCLGVNF